MATPPSAQEHHRQLLLSWITLVRSPEKRLAQREHDDIAGRWSAHVTCLKPAEPA